MQCQNCQSKEATHHLQMNINGMKTEAWLCESCARENGLYGEWENVIGSLLGGMMEGRPPSPRPEADARCPSCGATMASIAQSGRVGCATCYRHFNPQLMSQLRRLYGQNQHKGRVPRGMRQQIESRDRRETLQAKLRAAVEAEAYEAAARIRDELRAEEGEKNDG